MHATRLKKVSKMDSAGMGLAIEYLKKNREYLTHVEKNRIHTMIKTGRIDEAVRTITHIANERKVLINEPGRKAGKGKGRSGL